MTQDDGRKEQAKIIPILDVAAGLQIQNLRPAGVEHVGPCPVCGGRDRFAIHPKRQIFNCRGCGVGGDGLRLVEFVLDCDFKAALAYLVGEADVALDPAVIAKRKAKAEVEARRQAEYEAEARARAIRDAREIWHRAQPGAGTLAEAYLAARGVTFPEWPPTLRFLPDHGYYKFFKGRGYIVWMRAPCMIAGIQDATGRVTAVHQTYLDAKHLGKKATIVAPDGSLVDAKGDPWPAKLVRGSKKGGAIRLTGLGNSGVMIAGEGIETTGTALASGVRPSAAYWVCIDLDNMGGRMLKKPGVRYSGLADLSDARAWVPPEGITQLMFIEDGDSAPNKTRATLLAGIDRAQRLRPGLQGWIVEAAAGKDLNDMRMEQINGPD